MESVLSPVHRWERAKSSSSPPKSDTRMSGDQSLSYRHICRFIYASVTHSSSSVLDWKQKEGVCFQFFITWSSVDRFGFVMKQLRRPWFCICPERRSEGWEPRSRRRDLTERRAQTLSSALHSVLWSRSWITRIWLVHTLTHTHTCTPLHIKYIIKWI